MRQKLIKVLFIAIAMMSCINSVAYGSGSEEKKIQTNDNHPENIQNPAHCSG